MRAVEPTTDEAPDVLDAGSLVTAHRLVLLGRLRCADWLLEPCDQIRPHDPRSSPVCVGAMLADTDFVLALVHNFSCSLDNAFLFAKIKDKIFFISCNSNSRQTASTRI